MRRPLHTASSYATSSEANHSFWRSVSKVLGSRRETFPLSLLHAALDISGEALLKEEEDKGLLPAEYLSKIKRVNRRTLSMVLFTYVISFMCLLNGVGILISSTVMAPRHLEPKVDVLKPGLNDSSSLMMEMPVTTGSESNSERFRVDRAQFTKIPSIVKTENDNPVRLPYSPARIGVLDNISNETQKVMKKSPSNTHIIETRIVAE